MTMKKYYISTSIFALLIIVTYFLVPSYKLQTMIVISAVFAIYDIYLMAKDYRRNKNK